MRLILYQANYLIIAVIRTRNVVLNIINKKEQKWNNLTFGKDMLFYI